MECSKIPFELVAYRAPFLPREDFVLSLNRPDLLDRKDLEAIREGVAVERPFPLASTSRINDSCRVFDKPYSLAISSRVGMGVVMTTEWAIWLP
jgi:hypothetical protein